MEDLSGVRAVQWHGFGGPQRGRSFAD